MLRIVGIVVRRSRVGEVILAPARRRAIELARQQGARTLELRAAVSLCRVGQTCGASAAPRELLAALCDRFDTDERDNGDWRAAETCLGTTGR